MAIVTDPFDFSFGLKLPRNLQADIVTISREQLAYNNFSAVGGNSFIIRQSGEHEIKKVFVYGISASRSLASQNNANTIFRFEIGDIALAHLGGLNHSLTDKEFEELEDVDVLMIPVGGGEVIDFKTAAAIVNQIEPQIAIPMHYELPGLKGKFDKVEKFLKEFGLSKVEPVAKLKISKKDLTQESTQIIIMEKS